MRIIIFFFLLPVCVFVVERQPWFGNVYEFNFFSKYSYSSYSEVDSAVPPLKNRSHDQLLCFNLEFPFSSELSIDSDLEFTDTPRQSFSFRSFALQGRYLLSDDIIGDICSCAIGGNVRFVSKRSIKDVSCPYYKNAEIEATIALGKEFSQREFWKFRMWGLAGIGIANKGSPWVRCIISLEGNNEETYKYAIFLEGIHGYASKTTIDINNFNGYGSIREKNIDIGVRYGRRFSVCGTLSAEYKKRVLAKSCPKNVNMFSINYLLPFSF